MGEASASLPSSPASAGIPIRAVAVANVIERKTSVNSWASEAVGDLNRLAHVGSMFYLKAKGINSD